LQQDDLANLVEKSCHKPSWQAFTKRRHFKLNLRLFAVIFLNHAIFGRH